MKALDNEQIRAVYDATHLLFNLGLIDVFLYRALLEKINQNTGA